MPVFRGCSDKQRVTIGGGIQLAEKADFLVSRICVQRINLKQIRKGRPYTLIQWLSVLMTVS
jgi:hypothetical protein